MPEPFDSNPQLRERLASVAAAKPVEPDERIWSEICRRATDGAAERSASRGGVAVGRRSHRSLVTPLVGTAVVGCVAIVALVAAFAAFFSPDSALQVELDSPVSTPGAPVESQTDCPPPAASNADGGVARIEVWVFCVSADAPSHRAGMLVPVVRATPSAEDLVVRTLESLFDGLSPEQVAQGFHSQFQPGGGFPVSGASPPTPGSPLGLLTIDLADVGTNSDRLTESKGAAQLFATMFALDEVRMIEFRRDGEPWCAPAMGCDAEARVRRSDDLARSLRLAGPDECCTGQGAQVSAVWGNTSVTLERTDLGGSPPDPRVGLDDPEYSTTPAGGTVVRGLSAGSRTARFDCGAERRFDLTADTSEMTDPASVDDVLGRLVDRLVRPLCGVDESNLTGLYDGRASVAGPTSCLGMSNDPAACSE